MMRSIFLKARGFLRFSIAASLVLGAAGCELVTNPDLLQNFQWQAVENPTDVQEGIDAAVFAGDINMLGQLKTPTLCYRLVADFDRDGSNLNIRVDAESTDSQACAKTPGGFRYTGVLRNLGSGSYNLRIIHAVEGETEKVYTKALEIR